MASSRSFSHSFTSVLLFILAAGCVVIIAAFTYFLLSNTNNHTASEQNTAAPNSNIAASVEVESVPQQQQVRGTVSEVQDSEFSITVDAESSKTRTVNILYSDNTVVTEYDTTTPPVPGSQPEEPYTETDVTSITAGSIVVVQSAEVIAADATTVQAQDIIILK